MNVAALKQHRCHSNNIGVILTKADKKMFLSLFQSEGIERNMGATANTLACNVTFSLSLQMQNPGHLLGITILNKYSLL